MIELSALSVVLFQYLYAFSIMPMSTADLKDLVQQPATVTNNPYTSIVREKVRFVALIICAVKDLRVKDLHSVSFCAFVLCNKPPLVCP